PRCVRRRDHDGGGLADRRWERTQRRHVRGDGDPPPPARPRPRLIRPDLNGQNGPMELPDFHIDHSEKIDWMIETKGWALEAVSARPDLDPPAPSYAYSIGVPEAVGFTEIAVFGLAPAAANGLLQPVGDALRGGLEGARPARRWRLPRRHGDRARRGVGRPARQRIAVPVPPRRPRRTRRL